MPAVPTYQLALVHLGFDEQRVQVLEHLLVGLELLGAGRLLGQLGKAQLRGVSGISKESPS